MSSAEDAASLPYHEPGIVTILIISSFLLLLNAVNYILDRIVYCGLIGQLFVGIGWRIPGTGWLPEDLQHAVVQLGYIGLILIVYEGGISGNFQAFKANLFLSTAVALTGIAVPIGLSFVLLGLLPVSPVQAFAAGAALCSTSLGTTFTVLSTSRLTESRLGVVLSSAAMMDDVVGLIMVQVISRLGAGSAFDAVTVIRPVFVSIAFAVLVPLICLFIAKPVMLGACASLERRQNSRYRGLLISSNAAFCYQTGVLLAMITGATYAGTSNLFAAYLAGASVTWLSEQSPGRESERQPSGSPAASQISAAQPSNSTSASASMHKQMEDYSGTKIYEANCQPVVESILRPFFFASVGFAIPITRMFTGRVIWRGAVYTILMIFGKMVCGIWLVRFTSMPRAKSISKTLPSFKSWAAGSTKGSGATKEKPAEPFADSQPAIARQVTGPTHRSPATALCRETTEDAAPNAEPKITANTTRKRSVLPKPKSLYPAAILGGAMVSRGEISFLISSVAESNEVFGKGGNTEVFLVVTWAILLCTLIGPVTVGLLAKRVKRLQQAERRKANGQEDPLGVWGVLPPSGATSQ